VGALRGRGRADHHALYRANPWAQAAGRALHPRVPLRMLLEVSSSCWGD
jgi:hypothetical protein